MIHYFNKAKAVAAVHFLVIRFVLRDLLPWRGRERLGNDLRSVLVDRIARFVCRQFANHYIAFGGKVDQVSYMSHAFRCIGFEPANTVVLSVRFAGTTKSVGDWEVLAEPVERGADFTTKVVRRRVVVHKAVRSTEHPRRRDVVLVELVGHKSDEHRSTVSINLFG